MRWRVHKFCSTCCILQTGQQWTDEACLPSCTPASSHAPARLVSSSLYRLMSVLHSPSCAGLTQTSWGIWSLCQEDQCILCGSCIAESLFPSSNTKASSFWTFSHRRSKNGEETEVGLVGREALSSLETASRALMMTGPLWLFRISS